MVEMAGIGPIELLVLVFLLVLLLGGSLLAVILHRTR